MHRSDSWTFLTNHAHVLLCVSRSPDLRLREIAVQVGITERAVQRVVHDLAEAGYVVIEKEGRRNHYVVPADQKLRHPLEASTNVGDMLRLFASPVSAS